MRLREWLGSSGRDYLEVVASATILALLIMNFLVQPFLVEGTSMEPNLHTGERLLVSRLTYRFHAPKRFDVIVFRYPGNARIRYIKRVIGVPGDEIAIRGGRVFVGGVALREPYLVQETWGDYGPVRIPRGRLFVLGDNRGNSKDSRYPDVGLVSTKLVIGQAVAIYWPWANAGGVKGRGAAAVSE